MSLCHSTLSSDTCHRIEVAAATCKWIYFFVCDQLPLPLNRRISCDASEERQWQSNSYSGWARNSMWALSSQCVSHMLPTASRAQRERGGGRTSWSGSCVRFPSRQDMSCQMWTDYVSWGFGLRSYLFCIQFREFPANEELCFPFQECCARAHSVVSIVIPRIHQHFLWIFILPLAFRLAGHRRKNCTHSPRRTWNVWVFAVQCNACMWKVENLRNIRFSNCIRHTESSEAKKTQENYEKCHAIRRRSRKIKCENEYVANCYVRLTAGDVFSFPAESVCTTSSQLSRTINK